MSNMLNSQKKEIEDATLVRIKILATLVAIMLSVLTVRLLFLQVIKGDSFKMMAEENRIRAINITAPRGKIYDRNHGLLINNRLAMALTIMPKSFKNKRLLKRLSKLLGMPVNEIDKQISSKRSNPLKPKVVKRDISNELVAYIKEHQDKFPGIEIISEPIRDYPNKNLAAHVLGYLGEISDKEIELSKNKDYDLGDLIGKSGVEKEYENILRGSKGIEYIEVDAANRPIRTIKREEPDPGNNLILTIDKKIQASAESALTNAIEHAKKGKFKHAAAGAIVVMDPNNGEILAMASRPSYDPEIFIGGISNKQWNDLNSKSSLYPLNNRALMSSYPTGSTFKVVTALAGLANGIINPVTTFVCAGRWNGWGNGWTKWGWKRSGHGKVNLTRALTVSCDVYFYELSYRMYKKDNEALQYWARKLGLGSRTGIDLPSETRGRVPDKKWKKAFNKSWPENQTWFPGDTVNMAIGQGDVLLSPLQLANVYSTIVKDGVDYQPHIVKQILTTDGKVAADISPKVKNTLQLPAGYFEDIKNGLKKVTTSPEGTASSVFRNFPIPVGGKTGTSEVAGKDDFAFFAAYAPADDPKYVIAVVVEQGGHGGSTAAPAVRQILGDIYNIDTAATVGVDNSR